MKSILAESDSSLDNELSFYCGTGRRATIPFLICYQNGIKNISVFDGGWWAWQVNWQKEPENWPIQKVSPKDAKTYGQLKFAKKEVTTDSEGHKLMALKATVAENKLTCWPARVRKNIIYGYGSELSNIFVGNADRQPLKNVKFSVKKQGSDEVLSEISTDGNGIAEYTFPTAVKTLTYNISLNEESKFTGDKDVITVEVNEEGQIGKINGTAVDKPSINRILQLNAGEVLCVNKQNLEKAIKKAETYKEAGHTEESYKVLKNALAQAYSVNENENATQEQIDAAEEKLINAIDGLEKGPDYKTLHFAFVDSKGVAIPGLKFTVGNSWTPGITEIESDADGLAEYTTQGSNCKQQWESNS